MKAKRKKHLFNLVGIGIVIAWVIMIGLLIKKNNFNHLTEQPDSVAGEMLAPSSFQREWMEIYLKGKKVGYSVNQVSPLAEDYLMQEEIFLNLKLMGQPSRIHVVTRSVVDKRFSLKNFGFRMSSGIVSFKVSGKVEGDLMLLELGEGTPRRNETIKLSGPPVIGSGIAHFFRGRNVEVGQSFSFSVFDPSTMAQKEMIIRVAAKDTLVIRRMEYTGFRLEADMWGQPVTIWLDENGEVLKEEGIMGLTLVKSNAASAPRDIGRGGSKDLYELAAINVSRKLRDPEGLTYLKLKMEGLEQTHFNTDILNMGRQKFRSGISEIMQEETPLKATYSLPYSDRTGTMEPFLQPEFNIESEEKAILEKARGIAGDIKDPVTVARRLMAWIHSNIEKKPVLTVPSALEVLKTKVGDCNEHSVLLTALLRASGIPARSCAGLVYSRGKFFYHAWTEGYMGAWISMDAIMNQMPVDATHIKLVHGGLDRQVEIIGLIGKLRLEVIDYGYD